MTRDSSREARKILLHGVAGNNDGMRNPCACMSIVGWATFLQRWTAVRAAHFEMAPPIRACTIAVGVSFEFFMLA
jgi:hypothetical protein